MSWLIVTDLYNFRIILLTNVTRNRIECLHYAKYTNILLGKHEKTW